MNDDPAATQSPLRGLTDPDGYIIHHAWSRCERGQYFPISVVRIPSARSTRASWDIFARRCKVSFRCAYDALAVHQFSGKMAFRPILLDIVCTDGQKKIGQCGVTKNNQNQYSIEALQILPEYQELWEAAMTAVLRELGPARYHYGSHWSTEPPREGILRHIPGVEIDGVTPAIVEAIDFSRWESWEDYFRQISNNVRRNAARALREKPHLRIRIRFGLAALLDFLKVIYLQRLMNDRKGLNLSMITHGARLLLRILFLRNHVVSAVAIDRGRILATYSGTEFGSNSYYLNGSSTSHNGGAAWRLLLEMIKHAYTRTNGTGKFVMGSVRKSEPGWSGIHRSRLQCRVTDYPTSIISFSYRPYSNERNCRNEDV